MRMLNRFSAALVALLASNSLALAQTLPVPATGGTGAVASVTGASGVNCTPTTGSVVCAPAVKLGNNGAPITGTTYTVNCTTDANTELLFTGASAAVITIPSAATGNCGYGFGFSFVNQSSASATATLTPTTSLIGGASTKALTVGQSAVVFTENTSTNYSTENGNSAGSSSGTVNSGTTPNGAYYASSGTAVSDGGTAAVTYGNVNVANATGVATGIGLSAANTLGIYANGTLATSVNSTGISMGAKNIASVGLVTGNGASSGQLTGSTNATATNPTLVPRRDSATSGWGGNSAGVIDGILVGVDTWRLSPAGIQFYGTAPVPTGTGTPTINAKATDESGIVTAGTTAISVVITFNVPSTNARSCNVTSRTQLAAFAYTVSTTAITITQTATSGNLIDYSCHLLE